MKPFWKKQHTQVFAAAICIIILGLVGMAYSFNMTRRFYYTEYDQHISDVVEMVDHSVAEMLERCQTEMQFTMERWKYQKDENEYLETGDPSRLQEDLTQGILMNANLIQRVLVVQDGQVLFSNEKGDALTYRLIQHEDDSILSMCQDDNGQNYLCITDKIPNGRLEYVALIKLDNFYICTVASHVYDTYWIVLYDSGNDLFLQNEQQEPSFTFLTYQEAIDREDGYSIIARHDRECLSCTESYTYTNRFGERTESRICVISSDRSENGEFAVGVALASGVLFEKMRLNMTVMLIAAMLTLSGLVLGTHLIISAGLEKKRVENRLEILENEAAAHAQLLEQQKELAHHQRMETIGTLTAGIAHEFNNLLTPIMGYSMMILESNADDTEQYDNALEIYNASRKAKSLVSRISRLSGKNTESGHQLLSLTALIQASLEIAVPSKPNKVVVCLQTDDRAYLMGNASQLEQALLNLIINAFHAMQNEGGTLTVSTLLQKSTVVCRICDTGCGIPKELQEKVFDPFFTTKEPGKGTGLGLAIVAQAVLDHRGTVRVDSEPGHTVFTLTFPAVPPEKSIE